MPQTIPARTYVRSEKNEKFANDGSYESVRLMLMKIAGKCFSRAQALGLSMTLDDVIQEMNLSYVLARRRWDPTTGSRFSTYLQTSCYQNFNYRIERPEKDRVILGMVTMTDMQCVNNDGDDDSDPMERYNESDGGRLRASYWVGDSMHCEDGVDNMPAMAPMHVSPEHIVESRQNLRESLNNLTPSAKRIVSALLKSAREGEQTRLSKLAEEEGIGAVEMRRIRVELSKTFGIKL